MTVSIKRMNAINAKKMGDLESILFAGKQEYHNTAVTAQSAELHAYKVALQHAYDRMDAQDDTIAQLLMVVNKLQGQVDNLTMKMVRTGSVSITETTTTTTTVQVDAPISKWNKDRIFREFDLYRREHGLFSNLTPGDVRRINTSFLNPRPYTKTEHLPKGMTLGQLLRDYADERGINFA